LYRRPPHAPNGQDWGEFVEKKAQHFDIRTESAEKK